MLHEITIEGSPVSSFNLVEMAGIADPEGISFDHEMNRLWVSFDNGGSAAIFGTALLGAEARITSFTHDSVSRKSSLSFTSYTGALYAIDASFDLKVWFELDDNVVGREGVTTFTTTQDMLEAKRVFFRVRRWTP